MQPLPLRLLSKHQRRGFTDVLFTALFHEDAASPSGTLAGLPNRTAVSPAYKFPPSMREALPEHLRPMLDWELPTALEETAKL